MKTFMRILIGLGTMVAGFFGFIVLANNETVRERLKQHYDEAMVAGQSAAMAKRQVLEADLAKMMADKPVESKSEEQAESAD